MGHPDSSGVHGEVGRIGGLGVVGKPLGRGFCVLTERLANKGQRSALALPECLV